MAITSSDKESGAIHADPTKDFFVTMITRDISLTDCIFDLVDNSIDAARRQANASGAKSLKGYSAQINFDEKEFSISDNCGGISLTDAIDHAFHFGRRRDEATSGIRSIGLYGIGMKRAIFKIGKHAVVESETKEDSFFVEVEVEKWERAPGWDFEYHGRNSTGTTGTKIQIDDLYPYTANTFADNTFENELVRALARDYAFFIADGFQLEVRKKPVPQYKYELKEGAEVAPATEVYEDDGVQVRIVAGIAHELDSEIPEELRLDKVEHYGWFVVCNDRVVLAADKTERTVWGNDDFPVWHPQYNGFAGFVFFSSDDAKKLPWTTTKREIDVADPVYRRAIGRMKEITNDFKSYSQRRKIDPDTARQTERAAQSVDISHFTQTKQMTLPKVTPSTTGRRTSKTIVYTKPTLEVQEVAEALGNRGMSASKVGERTFEYFRKVELGK